MKSKKARPARSVADLSPLDEEGHVRVVVESPRGSRVKIAFDPELGAFAFSRALPTGITFPFDFGFVPGTLANDGDPLDAIVLHDEHSYPGIVIACSPVGVIEIDQTEDGESLRNDRLVLVPAEDPKARAQHGRDALTPRRKAELEEFFRAAVRFEKKRVKVLRWGDSRRARDLVDQAQAARRRRKGR
jgi:inorganic pyrophosphatase